MGRPPLTKATANTGIPLQMPLSQGPFIWSPGCLANYWLPHLVASSVKPGPHTQRAKREEKAGRCRVVCGGFNEQGTSPTGLSWALKEKEISEPACHNLNSIYRGFDGFQPHVLSRWSHDTLLSQGCILENGSGCGISGQSIHQGQERRGEACDCRGPSGGSTGGHVLSMTSANTES